MADDVVATAEPKRRGRPPKPKAGDPGFKPDHTGPQPHFPVYGESWQEKEGGPIKWWHGSGFYLEPPGKASRGSAAAADAAGPDEERQEDENESVNDAAPVDSSGEYSDAVAQDDFEPFADVSLDDDEPSPAIAQMENLASSYQLGEIKFLCADARDFMLEQFKNRPKPWGAMTEAEQRDVVAALDHAALELVRKTVEHLAVDGKDPIRCLLESYVEKDGVKVTLKVKSFSEEESLAAIVGLHQARGKHVLLTVASADDYRAERPAETDPDEPGLVFEAGPVEHPEDDSDLAGEDDEDFAASGDD